MNDVLRYCNGLQRVDLSASKNFAHHVITKKIIHTNYLETSGFRMKDPCNTNIYTILLFRRKIFI